MPPRILCLGHAAQDLIYQVPFLPQRPVKIVATAFNECGGGMAANAAVAVARLGGRSSYWGRVADDAIGARILDELASERVDVSLARRVPGCRSPVTSILVTPDGERLICSFTDAAIDPDPGWMPLERLGDFDAALVDVRWPEGSRSVLDSMARLGKPALLDADVGPPEVIQELAARATHALFSSAGLDTLLPRVSPGEALRRIRRPQHAVVGVTLGEDGFLWLEDGTEQRMPALRVVAVDTLAAGDVWHGAFTLALGERRSTAEAARFANAAAALKCQRHGGRRGTPTREEVEAALAALDVS